MKIKYLKDMHNAKEGDVLEVNSLQAKVLILRGIAELVNEQSEVKGTKKQRTKGK